MVTIAQAQTVSCPNCNARPGEPCNVPTETGRRDVGWVHLSREAAYGDRSAEGNNNA